MPEDNSAEIVKEAAEAVSFENVKVGGGAPSFLQALALQNAVAHQQAMQLKMQQQADVGTAISGKIAEMIIATSPSEGGADVAALGALSKMLQGMPPPTNLPTQGLVPGQTA